MGLSEVLREAVTCKKSTTASASGLGSRHGDREGGGEQEQMDDHEAALLICLSV